MTAEQILTGLSLVDQRYIEEAMQVRKQRSGSGRRLAALILAAALALLLISCGVAALSGETIREWFLKYEMEQYLLRMGAEEIKFIGMTEDYALVVYGGMGPSLCLYQYEASEKDIKVTAVAEGEYAISGGLSVNYVETNGRHIYFGTINGSHWNPAENVAAKFSPECLRVTDGEGNAHELDAAKGGYLCVLDSPMSNFQLIGQDGVIYLDYESYQAQGYPVEECQWQEREGEE